MYDYDNVEYKELMQKFRNLMELHNNQKKLLARLQARNLELQAQLDNLKGLPLASNTQDEDNDEDDDMISDSKYY